MHVQLRVSRDFLKVTKKLPPTTECVTGRSTRGPVRGMTPAHWETPPLLEAQAVSGRRPQSCCSSYWLPPHRGAAPASHCCSFNSPSCAPGCPGTNSGQHRHSLLPDAPPPFVTFYFLYCWLNIYHITLYAYQNYLMITS